MRISGPNAFDALKCLCPTPLPQARMAALKKLYRHDGEVLDHALVICFPKPHSFTGDDLVELHLHGSTAVLRACIAELSAMPGLRLAEPGEFTRRAFSSGKFDLLEVEALADVIHAETDQQARQALRQLEGYTGRKYTQMRATIVEALALLEAYIDFPEEEIPENVLGQMCASTMSLMRKIEHFLEDGRVGERIRNGFQVAIIGAPNVGKSSLLNALAKRDAAIVSPIAGTTRDVIDLHMDIAGFPVILSDTAGLRETSDMVENMGIAKSKATLEKADILLLLLDAGSMEESFLMLNNDDFDFQKPTILCVNKCDLKGAHDRLINDANLLISSTNINPDAIIAISAAKGTHLQHLEKALANLLNAQQLSENPIITQSRHRVLLEAALEHLKASLAPLPLELRCEELRLAAASIGKISGAILPDELLGHIFSKFCIGK